MCKKFLLYFLSLAFITIRCTGLVTTPPAMVTLPTPTTITLPTISSPVTATSTPLSTPTSTVTPTLVNRWRCDPRGGIACFDSFTALTMASADESWATTRRGNVFHYTTQPGDTAAAWRQLDPKVAIPFRKLVMVSPTEGWAIGTSMEAPFVHYKDGHWQSVPGCVVLRI